MTKDNSTGKDKEFYDLGKKMFDHIQALTQPEQEPVAWRNAAIRLGEDLHSVGPNGYYDMTAKQWLDWALSVVNTTPQELAKPEQEFKYTEYGLRGDENGKLSIGEIPRKEWVRLTNLDIHVLKINYDKVKVVYTDHAKDLSVLGQDVDVDALINEIQTKLKELNT